MNDFLGNTIEVGDQVVIQEKNKTSAWLTMAKVEGFSARFVKVSYFDSLRGLYGSHTFRSVSPAKVVSLDAYRRYHGW